MEEYGQQNITLLKREKKDVLLPHKDSHVSHIFEHNGPHTPHSVSNENLVQATMNVGGNCTEERNPQDYQLFSESGASFMTALSQDQPQLILGIERPVVFRETNSRDKAVVNNESSHVHAEIEKIRSNASGSSLTGHMLKPKVYATHSLTTASKGRDSSPSRKPSDVDMAIRANAIAANRGWNGIDSASKHSPESSSRPPSLVISGVDVESKRLGDDERHQLNKDGKLNNAQLLPPSDNYNMQLLAHSAQQRQQVFLMQQRHQQEGYSQGSSSAALQQLAKLRQQQQEQGVELSESRPHPTSKSSPFSYLLPVKDDVRMASYVKNMPPSLLVSAQANAFTTSLVHATSGRSPYHIPSNYGGWASSERSTPDFLRGHVRDLSFGSQGSPVHSILSSDVAKSIKNEPPECNIKHQTTLPAVNRNDGPELKSPLDHPEHQIDRKRNRFFSDDTAAGQPGAEDSQNSDDEAPLNDRDKKAAAAIGELLEQNEKVSMVLPFTSFGSKPVDGDLHRAQDYSSLPTVATAHIRKLQQEIARNTPPPAYEHPILPEQALQHMLHSGPPLLLAASHPPLHVETNPIKQEPSSPVVTSRYHYLPSSALSDSGQVQHPTAVVESQSNYIFQNPERQQIGGPNIRPSERTSSGISSCPPSQPAQKNPYDQLSASSDTPKSSTSGRPRKSSSSSSERKKQDGNLTCNLCGHSFRSTPALNGHMRVHSASDKKQNKEVRRMRTVSADLANTTSPMVTEESSPALYREDPKQSNIPGSVDMPMSGHTINDISHSQQYPPDAQSMTLQNRGHNGLLTMASAACYLKTDTPGAESVYPTSVLPQAYVVPPTVLFQQPSVVNVFNSNISENQLTVKPEVTQAAADGQGMNYPQIYATSFQQGLPFGNISFLPNVPQVPQSLALSNAVYSGVQQQTVVSSLDRGDIPLNVQNYVDQQGVANIEVKPMFAIAPEEGYPTQYAPQPLVEANSLSQLASIAVAAASRNPVPEIALQSDFQASYSQNEEQPSISAPPPSAHEWMSTSVAPDPHQDCISQQEMFQNSNLAPETSPIRSGHDPYILPVTVPVPEEQQEQRFGGYNSNPAGPLSAGHRELQVTWKDNMVVGNHQNALISSYDDPLMQEAVDVANPSKILPNSMMGGNPPTGSSLFSGARPFRQRHHSEGAHLIKSSETSLLKQILHSPVPTVKLRGTITSSADQAVNAGKQFNPSNALEKQTSSNEVEKTAKLTSPKQNTKKVEEFWAEPKPIQRRIRRRRHSADCRLQLKSGHLASSRQHPLASPNKKANLLRSEVRVRPRPPPLVIPSSVNTFTSGVPPHPAFYQSNLHHRRRPSGDSSSSYNGTNDKIPPYTPPPMLSPRRAGSGLFCTTPITPMFNRQKSIDAAIPTIPEEDETQEEDEELMRSSEPKINIGARFQAVIPKMSSKRKIQHCKHKADRIWIPEATAKDSNTFKHVEQLMELSCSAVVPFGGSNKEYALDCVVQAKGDILAAVQRLVKRKPNISSLVKFGKHYTGCGRAWSPQEAKLFNDAMVDNRKDFYVISKMVKSRTTAECVERYYHVTKRLRRRVTLPRRFKDQESNNLMSILESSSLDQIKADSFTSASSSDDDHTSKKKQPHSGADVNTWEPSEKYASQSQQSATACYNTALQSGNTPPGPQQHGAKHIKTHAARLQLGQAASPSPAGSPMSNVSNDDQPAQIFTCPVCGKSFGKVKSRNAHMKTHGKQAQEKRRLREEEAARRNNPSQSHRPAMPPIHRPNFPRPAPQLFQHPQLSAMQHPHPTMPRFGNM